MLLAENSVCWPSLFPTTSHIIIPDTDRNREFNNSPEENTMGAQKENHRDTTPLMHIAIACNDNGRDVA